MSKETYVVQVKGLPVKVYAASKSQAELAAKLLERDPPPDLSKDAQAKRMADALAEAKKRDAARERLKCRICGTWCEVYRH